VAKKRTCAAGIANVAKGVGSLEIGLGDIMKVSILALRAGPRGNLGGVAVGSVGVINALSSRANGPGNYRVCLINT